MSKNIKHELKCDEMAEMADRFLPLNSWNFKQNARIVTPLPTLIYDSEWCRVKVSWQGWDMYVGDTVIIYYGRLHALSDKSTMIWNGEECHCWHHVNDFLYFLDGLSPSESSQRKWPYFVEQFAYSEAAKNISDQPQKQLMMHGAIWEHYGKRIFELFDLRRPDLWEKFADFLKEYYSIKSVRTMHINPPLYKVC